MTQEAIRIPSLGAVFWAEAMPDGSSGARAIAGSPPQIRATLTAPLPRGLSAVTGQRGLVVLASPVSNGSALTFPPVAVQGYAEALDGRFHPRKFSVTLTPTAPIYVALRPTPQSTRIGEAGAVALNLRWKDGRPASWCVVRLACTRNSVLLGFSGQADIHGDVIVPLTGLPPLLAAQTGDDMTITTITVRGDPAQSGAAIADPDAFAPVDVSTGGGFAPGQTVTVKRGGINTAATFQIPGVTLQSS